MMANIPICTHLSNHIFPNQSSFGKALPGIVSNSVEIITHSTGNRKEGLMLFNRKNFGNNKQDFSLDWAKRKGAPKEAPLFNQL